MPRKSKKPLVSCIMPTYNRRHFVGLALQYFQRQDYSPRELIIIDDGSDAVGDSVPCDSRFRYIHLGMRATIGAKRNLACEYARGDIIVHWDDDDWSAPQRLSYVVGALLREKADLCGLNPALFYDTRSQEAWQYRYPPEERFWVHGNSLCYRRTFWEGNRFADVNVGEDNQFIWNAPPSRMVALADPSCHVGIIHEHNVSAKPGGSNWQPYPASDIQRMLGRDWGCYKNGAPAGLPAPAKVEMGPFWEENPPAPPRAARVAVEKANAATPPELIAPDTSSIHLGGKPIEVSVPSHHGDGQRSSTLIDCLGRAEITLPDEPICAERCIATIISTATSPPSGGYPFRKNYLEYLDDLLGSLAANADCNDAHVVVFVVGDEPEGERIAAKYGATVVRCRQLTKINATLKSVMYSIPHIVKARFFLCLDADMLVLGDLKPIFSALEALPESTILAAPELNHTEPMTLVNALQRIYYGSEADLHRLLGTPADEAQYPVVVNDGLFAGSRTALLALDKCIRAMPEAIVWTDERDDVWWRNQFVFNLALAKLGCGQYLDHSYNLQLHFHDAEVHRGPGGIRAYWNERPVKVLHRNGVGREKYSELAGFFARGSEALVSSGQGDSYAHFLRVLRAWIGRHGLDAMAWSFYGTADTFSGRIRDPDAMPLFGLLYYLIRSNGCVRVLETGTARGVSAACMASALAHRAGGQVVTLDTSVFPEREDLWAALPRAVHACIQPRAVDAVQGMISAWDAGERYDAVLLDTIHTQEQVWAEFQWARKLVCPGGLIMIHDPCWVSGTVEAALKQITSAGYGVVRLWTAESGVCEDDHLGLAIIENRPYTI